MTYSADFEANSDRLEMSPTKLLQLAVQKRNTMNQQRSKEKDFRKELLNTDFIRGLCKYLGEGCAKQKRRNRIRLLKRRRARWCNAMERCMEVSVFDIPLPADNQQSGDSSESIGSENNQYFTQQETLQKQNDNFGSADISEDDQSNDIIYPFGSKRLKPDDYSNPLCDLLPFDGVMSSPPPELSSEIVCEGARTTQWTEMIAL